MWIRDGVLVNRMHINAVAFAYAAYAGLKSDSDKVTLAELVNFAMAKSGMSCQQKMRLFNLEVAHCIGDPLAATDLYNELATDAARSAKFFHGAIETLRRLKAAGTKNFITSAVEQKILDQWLTSEQGQYMEPLLNETLGRRDNLSKGEEHFRYVSQLVDGQPIYYVADAEFEIKQAASLKQDFNIMPIGFSHFIDIKDILKAEKLVRTACSAPRVSLKLTTEGAIDCNELILPSQKTIRENLLNAGAVAVVDDFAELAKYFY